MFGLRNNKSKSDAITLIWTKEGRYWKVVAWEVEGEGSRPGIGRDTRVANAAERTAKRKITADPAVVQASHDFLHTWLVNDDYEKASIPGPPQADMIGAPPRSSAKTLSQCFLRIVRRNSDWM